MLCNLDQGSSCKFYIPQGGAIAVTNIIDVELFAHFIAKRYENAYKIC